MCTEIKIENAIYFCLLLVVLGCSTSNKPDPIGSDKDQASSSEERKYLGFDTAIALTFINEYAQNVDQIHAFDLIDSSSHVTENFKLELHALIDELEGQIGFDPILDAQDSPDEFEIFEVDTLSGLVVLRGKQWRSFVVNMKVVVENGQTLVDGCGMVNLAPEFRADR